MASENSACEIPPILKPGSIRAQLSRQRRKDGMRCWLISYFGPDKLITDVTDDDVTKLVAWQRAHRRTVHRKRPVAKEEPPLPFIASATVNRSTTEVLKKLFTRAKTWGVKFEHEPNWIKHWLSEPEERVRELKASELEKLDDTAGRLSAGHGLCRRLWGTARRVSV